jgi:hypothetical protein
MAATNIKEALKGDIRKEISLPLSKAVEIGFRNMRVRLGRTLITAGGVVLGIAFLTYIWHSQAILGEILDNGPEELTVNLTVPDEEARAQSVWLVTLSLLVSAVGITNSMLMAVTERYREIGTMKCLGALDGFVVKMFLIESGFQGFVGSLTGCVFGGLLAIAAMSIRFGGMAFDFFPLVPILKYVAIALAIGMFLSVLSAIYPAYVASRMVPADALRTEI